MNQRNSLIFFDEIRMNARIIIGIIVFTLISVICE